MHLNTTYFDLLFLFENAGNEPGNRISTFQKAIFAPKSIVFGEIAAEYRHVSPRPLISDLYSDCCAVINALGFIV